MKKLFLLLLTTCTLQQTDAMSTRAENKKRERDERVAEEQTITQRRITQTQERDQRAFVRLLRYHPLKELILPMYNGLVQIPDSADKAQLINIITHLNDEQLPENFDAEHINEVTQRLNLFPQWNALRNAILRHVEAARYAEEEAREVKEVTRMAAINNYHTALQHAAVNNRIKAVKALLTNPSINVNAQNKFDETALRIAAENNHTAVVIALLTHKDINVNLKDNTYGNTALHFAVFHRNLEMVNALLKHSRINVDVPNKRRSTALMWAADNGCLTVLAALLAAGSNVNLQNIHGHTALHIAAKEGHILIVYALLNAGSNINLQDIDKKTAYNLAVESGHSEIADLLKPRD